MTGEPDLALPTSPAWSSKMIMSDQMTVIPILLRSSGMRKGEKRNLQRSRPGAPRLARRVKSRSDGSASASPSSFFFLISPFNVHRPVGRGCGGPTNRKTRRDALVISTDYQRYSFRSQPHRRNRGGGRGEDGSPLSSCSTRTSSWPTSRPSNLSYGVRRRGQAIQRGTDSRTGTSINRKRQSISSALSHSPNSDPVPLLAQRPYHARSSFRVDGEERGEGAPTDGPTHRR